MFFSAEYRDVNIYILLYISDQDIINIQLTSKYFYNLFVNSNVWQLRFAKYLTTELYHDKPKDLPYIYWYNFWRAHSIPNTLLPSYNDKITSALKLTSIQNYYRIRAALGHINERNVHFRYPPKVLIDLIVYDRGNYTDTSIKYMLASVSDEHFNMLFNEMLENLRIDYIKLVLADPVLKSRITNCIVFTVYASPTIIRLLGDIKYTLNYDRGFINEEVETFKTLLRCDCKEDIDWFLNEKGYNKSDYQLALCAIGKSIDIPIDIYPYFIYLSHYSPDQAFDFYKLHKDELIYDSHEYEYFDVFAGNIEQFREYLSVSIPCFPSKDFCEDLTKLKELIELLKELRLTSYLLSYVRNSLDNSNCYNWLEALTDCSALDVNTRKAFFMTGFRDIEKYLSR